ncbi:MAG: hypothetical protein ACJ74Z_22305 [Bryobacteraceae bacterium]
MSTTTRSYTGWLKEASDEETLDGRAAIYERFIGRHMAQAAIAEYNSTWGDHHGREITTRQSQRKFANALAEAQTERALIT